MKHLILRYDYSGSDQSHTADSFSVLRHNIIKNDHSDHNRYLGMQPMIKKPTASLFLLAFLYTQTRLLKKFLSD
jgi:hypothetical protein